MKIWDMECAAYAAAEQKKEEAANLEEKYDINLRDFDDSSDED